MCPVTEQVFLLWICNFGGRGVIAVFGLEVMAEQISNTLQAVL